MNDTPRPGVILLEPYTESMDIVKALLRAQENQHVILPLADDDSPESATTRVRTAMSRARSQARKTLGSRMKQFKLGVEFEEKGRRVHFFRYQSDTDILTEEFARMDGDVTP